MSNKLIFTLLGIGYCILSYVVVASALKDTLNQKTKLWILLVPFSPILFLLYIIGSAMDK
ncbi:MAG: hypothetical protein COX90_00030 [Candidatus Nealsonbacteria bacterium CG_4_10_14_0_2_um_filter_38_17]|uniref:Cardiolipin synthase N-terminal domain-containing protein n=2 Tax=Candidatus Nealsoniibacteriota TaxID=1817911 RepID=A0A2M7UZ99_9BACT|nr:MAG: hypothetical protein COX36_01945 [Candidatus Nealsonbacteria bacterium CG23_combo_of_CG06-09_8_20_14_all_38_19]PIZ89304.1 MAG: hypothetical protein COX90_00030 [Candidatus Nealsonbacteria bacterium CG_4_10_14_0_2_um_filter_38_17]